MKLLCQQIHRQGVEPRTASLRLAQNCCVIEGSSESSLIDNGVMKEMTPCHKSIAC
jgi:hypothetical protein